MGLGILRLVRGLFGVLLGTGLYLFYAARLVGTYVVSGKSPGIIDPAPWPPIYRDRCHIRLADTRQSGPTHGSEYL